MKRDVRRARKRGKDMNKLISVLQVLQHGNSLPEKYRDHQLGGNLRDFRECHIEPDWLLLYQIHEDQLILSASATGTHADLFGA
jgi:addiction module toxin, relE/stbE family